MQVLVQNLHKFSTISFIFSVASLLLFTSGWYILARFLNACLISSLDAFLEKYNTSDDTISLFGSFKYLRPYAAYITLIWFAILVGFYLMGVPIGIGAFPGVTYGA